MLVALAALHSAPADAQTKRPSSPAAVRPPVSRAAAEKTANEARAANLKAQGDDAMTSLRYGDALQAYTAAYTLLPAPALLYNKGRVLQALGRFPEALAELRRFEAEAPPELRARVPQLAALVDEVAVRVSSLALTCNVEGARVHVRDVVAGTAPFSTPLLLNAGPASIEVEAEGYFPLRKQVDLPGKGTLSLDVVLVSKATTGLVVVQASERGATLAVDGKHAGVTPIELSLTAGTHRLVLRHPDRGELDTSVLVKAGESRTLDLVLPSRSLAGRPWFWAGVGLVTAGVVAVIVVSQLERSADRGTIEPGQVASPLVRSPAGAFAAPRFSF